MSITGLGTFQECIQKRERLGGCGIYRERVICWLEGLRSWRADAVWKRSLESHKVLGVDFWGKHEWQSQKRPKSFFSLQPTVEGDRRLFCSTVGEGSGGMPATRNRSRCTVGDGKLMYVSVSKDYQLKEGCTAAFSVGVSPSRNPPVFISHCLLYVRLPLPRKSEPFIPSSPFTEIGTFYSSPDKL